MTLTLLKKLSKSLALSGAVVALIAPTSTAFADSATDVANATQAGAQYIASQQNPNGSIAGLGGESDWSVPAVEAAGQSATNLTSSDGNSLIDFLASDVLPSDTPATTIERRVIAISAADQDTADFNGIDYNAQLAAQHNNNQIGDVSLLNDDIFGVIAIDATGDESLTPIAQDGLDYFLSHQGADGGFSYTTDSCAWCGSDSNDTAAAIIAMYAAQDLGLTQDATAKAGALLYLLSTQKADGGFGYDIYSPSDGSSTAWGLMALNTIGDSVASQALLARNWLLSNQNPDGGFSFAAYGITNSDTYTTAHAIVALLGSTWLLDPAPTTPPSGGKGSGGTSATTPTQSTEAPVSASTTGNSYSGGQSSNGIGDLSQTGASTKDAVAIKQVAKTATAKASKSVVRYYLAILGLVAVVWFVLESRKARGVN